MNDGDDNVITSWHYDKDRTDDILSDFLIY